MAGLVVLQAQMLVPRAQFERIQLEIPKENQRCLVHVTKYQAGQQCLVQKFKPYASPSMIFVDNELPFSHFRRLQPLLMYNLLDNQLLRKLVMVLKLNHNLHRPGLGVSYMHSREINLWLRIQGLFELPLQQWILCYLAVQVWILGKSADAKDQMWAPVGTHFHQLTVAEPLVQARKDCTYGPLPALQVPSSIRGLRTCEVNT